MSIGVAPHKFFAPPHFWAGYATGHDFDKQYFNQVLLPQKHKNRLKTGQRFDSTTTFVT